MQAYQVIGAMSGTSLDGLDLCHCRFEFSGRHWTYRIAQATTLPYPAEFSARLSSVENDTALALAHLDAELGNVIGQEVHNFVQEHDLTPDFIASHGHTIFHQPDDGMTLQIGSGAAIAAASGVPTICDFRTNDVALGGQGAPLVPIGDQLLFADYDQCLNLGGIANTSYQINGKRIAFDICPVNMAMNAIALELGFAYDDEGKIAKSGTIDAELLEALNDLAYYRQAPPKTLGKEWYKEQFKPILTRFNPSEKDALTTLSEHVAQQIATATRQDNPQRILVTGGGAYNTFLIDRLNALSPNNFEIGPPELIEFKEAMIFGFLGVLRWRSEVNCLSSVTGASKDNIGGAVFLP
jgi:anhydro-N-acetylmuramic acid kinase